jgi:hypothetical protein
LRVKEIPPRGSSRVWVAAVLATALLTLVGVLTGVESTARVAPQSALGVALGPRLPVTAGHRGLVTPADALLRAAQAAEVGMPAGIVRTVGTHFVVDGQPWRFVGFNDYKLTSQTYTGYTCGGQHTDTEIAADFAAMHQLGVTVVRTWFFQSFIAGRDWSAFDRVLTDAGRNGIRVIPVLSNQWGSCENYNHTPQQYKTLTWYRSGYANQADYGMPMTYADYAAAVAQHYAGDSRIAFWQLMNEAEAEDSKAGTCEEHAAAAALRSFADRMTAIVKAADPYHLVSLGTTGDGGHCGVAGSDYQYVHGGAIDVCEYHDYLAVPEAGPRVNLCAGLQKPMFAGERGFSADLGTGAVTSATLARRARFFAQDIQATLGSDACQGYLIWSWSERGSVSFDVGTTDPAAGVIRQPSLTSPEAVYLAVSAQ